MSLYLKNELLIKSREELFKIALKEKLIDILTSDKSKKELVEIILKYRKDYMEYAIKEYTDIGFFNMQEIFDKRLLIYNKTYNDIEVVRKINIYQDIKYMKQEKYYVIIEKDLDIDPSIVFLVGKNNYIYSILNFEKDNEYRDKIYEKFNMVLNIDRFTELYNNSEKMYLIFFNSYNIEIINKIYNNENLELIPDKFIAYKIEITEFNYLAIEDTYDICPILISENKVVTRYFEYDFFIYVAKIENDNIELYYFEDAKNQIESKDFAINATYIENISYLLENQDEKIYLYDEFLNFKIMTKKKLLEKFFSQIKELIKSYSKKKYTKYQILGINYNEANMENISISTIFNYSIIKNKLLNINKEYISKPYLMIHTDNSNINISLNRYKLVEKDINYELSINTDIINECNISKDIIVNRFYYYLKYRIAKLEYLNFKEKNLLNKIKNEEYESIVDNIESKYIELEKCYNTDYLKYKSSVNKKYIEVYKNHLLLKKIANNIYEKYMNNENLNETYLEDLSVEKEKLDLIFVLEIYNFLYKHFKKYSIIDILKSYEGINLCGRLVKTKIFYNLLKEFIPGNLVIFDDDIKKTNMFLIENAYKYNKDINLGVIKLKEKITKIKSKILVYVKDFKDNYKLMLKTDEINFNYIDKISTVKKIEIKISYMDDKKEVIKKYILNNKFIEKDELEIDIDQKYLNDIENGVIRIFFKLLDDINICYVKREKDQLFLSENFDKL